MTPDEKPPKKDLTSLVDLAKLEPAPTEAVAPATEGLPEVAPLQESDFGTLDQMVIAPPPETTFSSGAPEQSAIEEMAPLTESFVEAAPVMISAPEEREAPLLTETFDSPVSTVDSLPEEPLVAAPVGADKSVHSSSEPLKSEAAISGIQKYADKFAIGHPRIDASPPFSFMAEFLYSERVEKRIRDVLDEEDFGVRFQDISVQLKSGKLFIPKISEFAAVTLAMKLRESVDDIQIGLASEIFKAKSLEESKDADFENILFEYETMETHEEDVRDLAAEPKNERELFTTHLTEIEGFKVTRILSAISVSKVIPSEIAEDDTGTKLEKETEELANELVSKSFKLGAHGVIGITFSLKSFEVATSLGRKKIYRLWGNGTAVRMRSIITDIQK